MRQHAAYWTGNVRERGRWRLALAAVATTALLAFAASPALAAPTLEDFSGGAHQILAPGEEGGFPFGTYATDQGKLYDALTPNFSDT